MLPLPNNCRCGEFTVTPKNWDQKDADPTLKWKVDFRFYDDNTGKNDRIRQTGGVNRIKTLKEKQKALKKLLANLLHDLQHGGWNPLKAELLETPEDIITIKAVLETALAKIKVVHSYHLVIKSMLKYVFISIDRLKYDSLPIENITRLHVKQIFEDLPKHKTTFSAYTHNSYRKDLHLLFEQIVDDELLENNPVTKLKKQKATENKRKIITKKERKLILTSKQVPYDFRRYIIIFFHSGARSTELLQVKKEDVYLTEQRFEIMQKKGRYYKKQDRIIKTIALPYWEELLNQAENGQYIFSVGLRPGNVSIGAGQISDRWKRHIKDKLGIEADFYSLKHANAGEVAELEDIETAKRLMGHKSKVITMNYYAMGEKERQRERLKALDNEF